MYSEVYTEVLSGPSVKTVLFFFLYIVIPRTIFLSCAIFTIYILTGKGLLESEHFVCHVSHILIVYTIFPEISLLFIGKNHPFLFLFSLYPYFTILLCLLVLVLASFISLVKKSFSIGAATFFIISSSHVRFHSIFFMDDPYAFLQLSSLIQLILN